LLNDPELVSGMLRIPLTGATRGIGATLRSNLSRAGEVALIALEGRQSGSSPQTQAVGSNTFLLRAAAVASTSGTSSIPTISAEQTSSSAPSSTATIAAVAATVGAVVAVAAALIVVVAIRRRWRDRALSVTDSPLQSAALPSTNNDLDI
jgi:hypothetical protein